MGLHTLQDGGDGFREYGGNIYEALGLQFGELITYREQFRFHSSHEVHLGDHVDDLTPLNLSG